MKTQLLIAVCATLPFTALADAFEAGAAGQNQVRIGAALTQPGYVHALGVRPRATAFTQKVEANEPIKAASLNESDEKAMKLLMEAELERKAMKNNAVKRQDLSIYGN